jgi:hypothetical protein
MAEAPDPGQWNELDGLEREVREQLAPLLDRLEGAIAVLHDAPNTLAALARREPKRPHLIVAGEALQRAMDDLRALWLLLQSGYTVPASAVAADLWEHAMLATCVAGEKTFAEEFTKPDPIERPEPGDLAARAVQLLAVPGDDAERMMLEFSVGYEWLRQLKHVTYPAIARGLVPESEGALRLGAHPRTGGDFDDTRMLLAVVFIALRRALTQLAAALDIDMAAEGREWQAHLDEAWRIVQETR